MLKIKLEENMQNTANLYLHGKNVSRISKLTPSVINLTGLHQPERHRVEEFIKGIYAKAYGAQISVEYPVLMSVRNAENDILAAVGIRYAAEENLFLEQYTITPIDDVLGVSRNKVVEIGNLASAGGGASIFLFAALSSYLNNRGIEYATVTGTDYLHRTFQKLGLNPKKLCDADVSLLQGSLENWGTYYDTMPRVLAGSVPQSFKQLQKALGAEFEDCRPELFSRLHYKS